MKRALISGSFDPPTLGHLDLIKRTAALFDEVVVCLFRNAEKTCRFSEGERLAMLKAMIEESALPQVRVDLCEGYVADYAAEHGISVVVRGVRDERDFVYEAEMARFNKERNPALETLLMPSSKTLMGVSSTEARKRLEMGENTETVLPQTVRELLEKRE